MRNFVNKPTAASMASPTSAQHRGTIGASTTRASNNNNSPTTTGKASTLRAKFDKPTTETTSSPSPSNNSSTPTNSNGTASKGHTWNAKTPTQASGNGSVSGASTANKTRPPIPFNNTTSSTTTNNSSPVQTSGSAPQAKPQQPTATAAPKVVSSPTPPQQQTKSFTPTQAKPPALNNDEVRTKPLQKPKPDMARQSTRFLGPIVTKEQPKAQPAPVPTPAPTPAPEPVRAPTVSVAPATPENNAFSISAKWKINFNELEFADLVSSGSAGEVYLGYYFGTPVAIKKLFALPDDQKHLVEREYSMLTECNHPNIIQFLGLCDHESGVYIITEYVEHGDLFDLLVFGDKKVDWKTKVKIALQVAQACFYLHSRGIIHRDLKSQNVLIGENYKVKVCDLGLATVLDNNKRTTVCGTNEWMAPEIMIQNSYDSKADVFSFGIVMQELITEAPPPKRLISKMLAFDVDAFIRSVPTDCPEAFAQLVIDCTRSNPQDRPPMKDVVSRLRKLNDE